MPAPYIKLRRWLRLLGGFILATGVLAAAVLHWSPRSDDDDIIGYTFEGGKAFPIRRGDYSLGGKANVLTTEFRDWFGSLWHGRKLAYTVAFLAVAGACACFIAEHFFVWPPPPDDRAVLHLLLAAAALFGLIALIFAKFGNPPGAASARAFEAPPVREAHRATG